MTPAEETWKPIPGFTGYEVSDRGRIRSYRRRCGLGEWYISDTPQRILRACKNSKGRLFVCIMNGDSERVVIPVHHLVMLAFVGSRPEGMEICHNDGNCANNNLSNLRYDTHVANMQDAAEAGNMAKVLDEDTVLAIRHLRNDKLSYQRISEQLAIPRRTANAAGSGRSWKHIGGPLTYGSAKLTENEILAILKRAQYEKQRRLAREYGVSESMVSRIVNGKRRLPANENERRDATTEGASG